MTEDELGQDPKSPQDARLASLDERLRRAQGEATRTGPDVHARVRTEDQGMRVLSVLVSYPLGSALIGWGIDRMIGTRWLVLVMLVLGFGAAVREVWKISQSSRKSGSGE